MSVIEEQSTSVKEETDIEGGLTSSSVIANEDFLSTEEEECADTQLTTAETCPSSPVSFYIYPAYIRILLSERFAVVQNTCC